MKICFLLENYHGFYTRHLEEHPELLSLPYTELTAKLFGQYFYQADSYSYGMKAIGNEPFEIIYDCAPLQQRWAMEHAPKLHPKWYFKAPYKWYYSRIKRVPDTYLHWRDRVLVEQIKQQQPDVVYCFSGVPVNAEVIREIKQYTRLVVLQWSVPPVYDIPYDAFDFIVSTSHYTGKMFDQKGLKNVLFHHFFDDRILEKVNLRSVSSKKDVLFIGSLRPADYFENRIKLLEFLSPHIEYDFYGPKDHLEVLPTNSPIHKHYRGEAFGVDMCNLIQQYKLIFHIHGNENDGAKRLYEAPGVGVFLLADRTPGIDDIYVNGQEIVIFEDEQDCLEKIRYYLASDGERNRIAENGHKRLMKDHTIVPRMKTLQQLLEKHL